MSTFNSVSWKFHRKIEETHRQKFKLCIKYYVLLHKIQTNLVDWTNQSAMENKYYQHKLADTPRSHMKLERTRSANSGTLATHIVSRRNTQFQFITCNLLD